MSDKASPSKKPTDSQDRSGMQNTETSNEPALSPFSAQSILQLQRLLGNQKTLNLIQRNPSKVSIQHRVNSSSVAIQRDTDVSAHLGIGVPVNVPDALAPIFQVNGVLIQGWLAGTDNQKRIQANRIKQYLNSDAANAAALFQHLRDVNAYFAATNFELRPANGGGYATVASLNTAVPLITAIADGRKPNVVQIYTTKGFPEILKIFTNPAAAAAIAALNPANMGANAAQHLSMDTLVAIGAVALAHGPGTGFAGGMVWGKGELPSVAVNQEAHFLKHCLRQYNADANPDVDEPWKWLQLTNYAMTIVKIEDYTGVLDAGVKQSIAGDTGKISSQPGANYFFNTYLPNLKNTNQGAYDNLINWLKVNYQPIYLNTVQGVTTALANPFVTVNNGKIQVVGINGQQFIVGKWDGAAFTISSSYLNIGKVAENTPFRLWNL